MELPEFIIEPLKSLMDKYLNKNKKRDFRRSPDKYLVSLILAMQENMKNDPSLVLLDRVVKDGTDDDYLKEAERLLEKKEGKPQKKAR